MPSLPELKAEAKSLGLRGYSTLRKHELVELLAKHKAPKEGRIEELVNHYTKPKEDKRKKALEAISERLKTATGKARVMKALKKYVEKKGKTIVKGYDFDSVLTAIDKIQEKIRGVHIDDKEYRYSLQREQYELFNIKREIEEKQRQKRKTITEGDVYDKLVEITREHDWDEIKRLRRNYVEYHTGYNDKLYMPGSSDFRDEIRFESDDADVEIEVHPSLGYYQLNILTHNTKDYPSGYPFSKALALVKSLIKPSNKLETKRYVKK